LCEPKRELASPLVLSLFPRSPSPPFFPTHDPQNNNSARLPCLPCRASSKAPACNGVALLTHFLSFFLSFCSFPTPRLPWSNNQRLRRQQLRTPTCPPATCGAARASALERWRCLRGCWCLRCCCCCCCCCSSSSAAAAAVVVGAAAGGPVAQAASGQGGDVAARGAPGAGRTSSVLARRCCKTVCRVAARVSLRPDAKQGGSALRSARGADEAHARAALTQETLATARSALFSSQSPARPPTCAAPQLGCACRCRWRSCF
jgi:hypothetical protein